METPETEWFVFLSGSIAITAMILPGVSGSFMLVRRRALDEVGPLDEGYFLHCEDLDWFARFARSRWKVYFVPDLEIIHHLADDCGEIVFGGSVVCHESISSWL